MSDDRSKDMIALANKLGIAGANGLKGTKLYKSIKDVIGSKSVNDAIAEHKAGKSAADIKGQMSSQTSTAKPVEVVKKVDDSKVEVLPPGQQGIAVHAPQIHMNVPAPVVNIGRSEAPAWHEITSTIWSTVQTLIVGAAGYAFVANWAPHFVHIASLP